MFEYDEPLFNYGYEEEEDNFEEQEEVENLIKEFSLELSEELEKETNDFNPMLQRHKK